MLNEKYKKIALDSGATWHPGTDDLTFDDVALQVFIRNLSRDQEPVGFISIGEEYVTMPWGQSVVKRAKLNTYEGKTVKEGDLFYTVAPVIPSKIEIPTTNEELEALISIFGGLLLDEHSVDIPAVGLRMLLGYVATNPNTVLESAKEVQWRNIRSVVKSIAEHCFGDAEHDRYGSSYIAVIAVANSLTAKDGLDFELEELPTFNPKEIIPELKELDCLKADFALAKKEIENLRAKNEEYEKALTALDQIKDTTKEQAVNLLLNHRISGLCDAITKAYKKFNSVKSVAEFQNEQAFDAFEEYEQLLNSLVERVIDHQYLICPNKKQAEKLIDTVLRVAETLILETHSIPQFTKARIEALRDQVYSFAA